ncbi:MAG: helix-turn-helix domain-containing protein [Gammaproteobacteria bacterium]|nr:helix-turn-helix domain-containing protein [Gammaproteobacteria bacterium]
METEIDSNDGSLPGAEAPKQTVGPLLKAERERQGFTEKEVADRLHITMHYVRSLETDGYEKLPGIVFARGYIKNYALLLGLDKDDLAAQFDTMVKGRNPPPQHTRTFINTGRRGKKQNQAVIWLLIAALAFLAGFLVFWSYNRFFATDQDQVAGFSAAQKSSSAVTDSTGSAPIRGVVERAESTRPIFQPGRSLIDSQLIYRGKNRWEVTELFTLGADLVQGDAASVSITLNQLDVPVTDNIRIDNTARLLVGI